MRQNQVRGWCIKFVTGLNIIIGIVQKVYQWPGCYFAKMILQWENHFLITHILFELWLWYLAQSQIWCITLYIQNTFIQRWYSDQNIKRILCSSSGGFYFSVGECLENSIAIYSFADKQSPQWEIFMEQELRFGLNFGRFGNFWGGFFHVFMSKKNF